MRGLVRVGCLLLFLFYLRKFLWANGAMVAAVGMAAKRLVGGGEWEVRKWKINKNENSPEAGESFKSTHIRLFFSHNTLFLPIALPPINGG